MLLITNSYLSRHLPHRLLLVTANSPCILHVLKCICNIFFYVMYDIICFNVNIYVFYIWLKAMQSLCYAYMPNFEHFV